MGFQIVYLTKDDLIYIRLIKDLFKDYGHSLTTSEVISSSLKNYAGHLGIRFAEIDLEDDDDV